LEDEAVVISFTIAQARRFMLLKHGLIGGYRFEGKSGTLAYIRQAGCIQFDPVDVCGKNAELALQSRVKGFTKTMLHSLLYEDRALMDYIDKNVAIVPTEDWPYFERYRRAARENAWNYPEMQDMMEMASSYIDTNGTVSSSDLPPELEGEFQWRSAVHWSGGKNKARAVLEQMYSEGKLVIHHKAGTRKYYDLAEKHIPAHFLDAPEPLPDELEHHKWRVLRRIGAVGLMWNRPSDAWLGIWDLNASRRAECFDQLHAEGKILEVNVEGIADTLFCRSEDMQIAETVLQNPVLKPRCELIAPLDCFLWDRKLIKALFDFDYTWEIYHPAHKRKYGYYVLPILYGERFAGRFEAAADRKTNTLVVRNIWYEENVKRTRSLEKALDGCIERFAKFNEAAWQIFQTPCLLH
jgi:uncharacterized protein YcaQ